LTSSVFLLVNRGGFEILDGAVASHLRSKAAQVLAVWEGTSAGVEAPIDMGRNLFAVAELQGRFFPGLLALASLAALAVAWWAFGRVRPGGQSPLARWRELPDHDELVWPLIVGPGLLPLSIDG